MLFFFFATPGDAADRPKKGLSDRERTALSAMFAQHHDVVWRVLRRSGLSEAQADDGAQQAFLVALRRLAEIQPGKERAFLCATALMVARKVKLQPSREVATEVLPDVEATHAAPDEQTEARRNRALLDKVLTRMEEDLRAVFVLQEIEGLSKREASDALGIPQGTVATRLRRARVAFEALLREDETTRSVR